MSGFDGTGPAGMGFMTGWGRGYCNPSQAGYGPAPAAGPGYLGAGYGRGFGRGFRGGFGPGRTSFCSSLHHKDSSLFFNRQYCSSDEHIFDGLIS